MKTNPLFFYKTFLLMALFIISCNEQSTIAGKYKTEITGKDGILSINLELKTTGQGSWSTDEDNVDFVWDTHGEKLLIHTKAGGVITGNVMEDVILLKIPGMEVYQFKRINR